MLSVSKIATSDFNPFTVIYDCNPSLYTDFVTNIRVVPSPVKLSISSILSPFPAIDEILTVSPALDGVSNVIDLLK